MKKNNRMLPVIGLCLSLCSCSNFLEQSAQDLVIPETIAQYKEILQGEAYFRDVLNNYMFIEYMTDDVEYFDAASMGTSMGLGEDSRLMTQFNSYAWSDEIENANFTDNLFRYLYKHVMTANVCLESIDAAEGTVTEKEILQGQASFVRAFAHFMLANTYAKPYNESSPNDLCIPLKMNSVPTTETYGRASVKEVWDLIVSDLNVAMEKLKDKKITNMYEVNYKAALVLSTRVALYMENWDRVIQLGELLVQSGEHPLFDISGKTSASSAVDGDVTIKNFVGYDNKEIVFLFGERQYELYSNRITGTNLSSIYFRVSSREAGNLISQYTYNTTTTEGDHRLAYWFLPPRSNETSSPSYRYNHRVLKYDIRDGEYYAQFALRSGEVYLSLAEAYARKSSPDVSKALGYLNALREKRIRPYTSLTSGDFPTSQALATFIWEERRRELCFEELHRWWDLRRTGQPKLVHRWRSNTYTLQQGDPAYVLNFPLFEREYNGVKLGSNPRPARGQD